MVAHFSSNCSNCRHPAARFCWQEVQARPLRANSPWTSLCSLQRYGSISVASRCAPQGPTTNNTAPTSSSPDRNIWRANSTSCSETGPSSTPCARSRMLLMFMCCCGSFELRSTIWRQAGAIRRYQADRPELGKRDHPLTVVYSVGWSPSSFIAQKVAGRKDLPPGNLDTP